MSRPRLHDRCAVPGCGDEHAANGYCSRHYHQVRKHGRVVSVEPLKRRGKPKTPPQADDAARLYRDLLRERRYLEKMLAGNQRDIDAVERLVRLPG